MATNCPIGPPFKRPQRAAFCGHCGHDIEPLTVIDICDAHGWVCETCHRTVAAEARRQAIAAVPT